MKKLFITILCVSIFVIDITITPDFCTHPGNATSCHGVPCNPEKDICPL